MVLRRGVPAEQIVAVYDAAASHSILRSSFSSRLERIPPGHQLILYYAGHGVWHAPSDTYYLTPHDALAADLAAAPSTWENVWPVHDIVAELTASFRGQRCIVIAASLFAQKGFNHAYGETKSLFLYIGTPFNITNIYVFINSLVQNMHTYIYMVLCQYMCWH